MEAKYSSSGVETENLNFEVFIVLYGNSRQVDHQLECPAVADAGLVGRYRLAGHLGEIHALAAVIYSDRWSIPSTTSYPR